MTSAPPNTLGSYLPNNVILGDDPHTLREQLIDLLQKNSDVTNKKEIATYLLNEIQNGQTFFTAGNPQIFRYAFRKVFNRTVTIAAGATDSFTHGLSQITAFTRFYGAAVVDNANLYRPIPYVDAAGGTAGIELNASSTQINIINGATAPDILSAIIVVEYLKE